MSRRRAGYTELDFIDSDAVTAAKARSPHARQNCQGSLRQLPGHLFDTTDVVECPICLRKLTGWTWQQDGPVRHPILPSHLPDQEGLQRVAQAAAKRNVSATPRPY